MNISKILKMADLFCKLAQEQDSEEAIKQSISEKINQAHTNWKQVIQSEASKIRLPYLVRLNIYSILEVRPNLDDFAQRAILENYEIFKVEGGKYIAVPDITAAPSQIRSFIGNIVTSGEQRFDVMGLIKRDAVLSERIKKYFTRSVGFKTPDSFDVKLS